MNRAGLRLIGGVSVIFVALGYLAFTGVRAGWVYYLGVDDYVALADAHGARSRIHGTVGEGATVDPTRFTARFQLVGQDSAVPVEYQGVVPDLFAVGREVVVEGTTDARGVFVADVMLTKCGSKYEPAGAGG